MRVVDVFPAAAAASPFLTLVALEIDYEDDRSDDLGGVIARAGATLHASDLVARHAHSLQRRVIIGSTDRGAIIRAVDAVRAVPGVRVVAEEDLALARHRGGKIKIVSRVSLDNAVEQQAVVGAGMARICQAIAERPGLAWGLTGIGRTVAIVSSGAHLPGLGAVGPLASLPAVEAIAVLYHQLAGLSAVPLVVSADCTEDFIDATARVSMGFGVLHLAHLATRDATVDREVERRTGKLVFRTERHGIPAAALAAAIRGTKLLGLDLRDAVVGQIGLGLTGTAIASLLRAYGVRTIVAHEMPDAEPADTARSELRVMPLDDLMRTATVVIAATGRGQVIPQRMIRRGQIVIALSPEPEIDAKEAYAAGAALAADARTLNDALVFPGLVRALLRVRATTIGDDALIAAATAVASCRVRSGWLPDVHDPWLHGGVFAEVRKVLPEPTVILPPGIDEVSG